MATNNNVQNVKFLRNGSVFVPGENQTAREVALNEMNGQLNGLADGTAILGRYQESNGTVKTLVGFAYVSGDIKTLTVFDVEGASADVEKLREEINAKLGEGITSANTVTEQLEALSGSTADTSASTSVAGAKAYADDLIGTLDYIDTAVTGSYVSEVTQSDGKIISTTKVELPSVNAITEAGKPIIAVAEDKGTVSASAGTINAEYVNITDGGDKFTATTVEGALAELDDKIDNVIDGLDYTGVTTGDGVYVTNVVETNGVISATTATLPSVTGEVESKKVVMSVSEDKGEIAVTKGTIESSDKTVVIGDLAEGNGIDFKVNIDSETLIADTGTGVISVASAALTQYVGDDNTIQISAVDPATNTKTISSPLTIQKVTTGLSEEVKEEYRLVGASGNTIGAPVQIYKDSHIVSINYITTGEHAQNLEYVYIDASGNTQTTYVDMSELVLEAEFASGVTITDHVAHGVVDSTSETFLTVGADGFKLAGVQDAIDAAVAGLDADESGSTEHITVNVVEENGVIKTVTVEEDNIANADDLAELSGKTITAITSTNGSISATISNEAGNKTADIQTDADKIKMSGFSAENTTALSGIAESDSIATAFEKTNAVITENERVTAEALTDLDERLDVVEGEYISGVSVNGAAVTLANKVAPISITAATSATTAETSNAIVVNTDANGNITLGLNYIDAGLY